MWNIQFGYEQIRMHHLVKTTQKLICNTITSKIQSTEFHPTKIDFNLPHTNFKLKAIDQMLQLNEKN